jgi:hypothetical protein
VAPAKIRRAGGAGRGKRFEEDHNEAGSWFGGVGDVRGSPTGLSMMALGQSNGRGGRLTSRRGPGHRRCARHGGNKAILWPEVADDGSRPWRRKGHGGAQCSDAGDDLPLGNYDSEAKQGRRLVKAEPVTVEVARASGGIERHRARSKGGRAELL